MGANPTIIPDFGQDFWLQGMKTLFPNGWVGTSAPDPNFTAVMEACAENQEQINQFMVYGFLAARIATAVGGELDLVGQDFYGDALRRSPGETDASYRKRIQAALLQGNITRQNIANILFRLTDQQPRMMEPWYLPDTCAFDGLSYYDIDTVANPFRWASPELRYQGFIETTLPPFSGNEGNPVWTFDDGFSWDTGPSCWLDPSSGWFIGETEIDNAIVNAHAFGTIIWRKLISNAVPYITGSTLVVPEGDYSVPISLVQTAPYSVLIQPSWNSNGWVVGQSLDGFVATFSTPAPAGATFDYLVIPQTIPNSGFEFVPVGSTGSILDIVSGGIVMITANWNTHWYVSDITSDSETFQWTTPTPAPDILPNAGFAYLQFPLSQSGGTPVDEGASSWTVPLPQIQTQPFVAFAMPNWNTTCAVTKTNSALTIAFSNAAPAGALLQWAIYPV